MHLSLSRPGSQERLKGEENNLKRVLIDAKL